MRGRVTQALTRAIAAAQYELDRDGVGAHITVDLPYSEFAEVAGDALPGLKSYGGRPGTVTLLGATVRLSDPGGPERMVSEFHSICRDIISRADESQGANFAWAVNYCRDGLMIHTPSSVRIQIWYVLRSLTGWRGPTAKKIKGDLERLYADLSDAR